MNKINSVLKEVLPFAKPSDKEMNEIKEKLNAFLKKIDANRKKARINAQIFVGGSWAKGTIIKKDSYDIDIFVRFDKKYRDSMLSDITEKMLKGQKAERIHGSRDYFKIKSEDGLFFEIIPVKMVNNPKEAENVTDLSYSHVNYIKKKIKTQKILDEIRLAKAFCYANNAYGAESYIRGFSGYAIELLVNYYGSFLRFVNAIAKIKEKEVIDIEKLYKNKSQILMDINEAKLKSPIILIDPTYKQRNVLAALSDETLKRFQKSCIEFIKNPSANFFRIEAVDIKKIIADSKKKGLEFVLLDISTNKQKGDIAGSKLLKFYRHLNNEILGFFEIKAKGFEYFGEKRARAFFVVKSKGSFIAKGPKVNDEKNARKFRLKHKIISIKNGHLYSKIKADYFLNDFLMRWKAKNMKIIKDMSITGLNVHE